MKHGCFLLRSISFFVFCAGLFLLYSSQAKADSMKFLNDFRSNDLTGTTTGLFKTAGGSVDPVIAQDELNSLKITGTEPNHSVSFYRKNSRDVRGDFFYDQHANVPELGLDFRTSEALINFISASAF